MKEPLDFQTLYDWLISSVEDSIFTEEHIEQLLETFDVSFKEEK